MAKGLKAGKVANQAETDGGEAACYGGGPLRQPEAPKSNFGYMGHFAKPENMAKGHNDMDDSSGTADFGRKRRSEFDDIFADAAAKVAAGSITKADYNTTIKKSSKGGPTGGR